MYVSVRKSHVTYFNHWVVVYVLVGKNLLMPVGFRIKSNILGLNLTLLLRLCIFDFYCQWILEIAILF